MSRGSTTTTYLHSDGVHPTERTVVTQENSGMNVGGAMPFGVNGGYYGMPIVNGYGMLHNDERVAVYQTTINRPTIVVSHGADGTVVASGGTGNGTAPAGTSDHEARLARLEALVSKIWGGEIQSLHQSCLLAIAHPDAIKDEARRAAVVKDCEAFLAEEANQKGE